MILLTMLLIPTLIALGFMVLGGKDVTLLEFVTQLVVQTAVMAIVAYVIGCQNTHDVEVLNGRVTGKTKDEVSCSHSYECNCYDSCSTDSKGNTSCTRICSTCYEHDYDIDWNVSTSIGWNVNIDRVDRQGLVAPTRWKKVIIGEPITLSHSYTNYVKASPDSLFRRQGLVEKYAKSIPPYPGEVYDYYRLDRLVTVGATIPEREQWNKHLSEVNADLGIRKQVNMVLVVTVDAPEEYFYALEQAWIGGKKNDAVLVVNTDSAGKITWTNVMAWTDNKLFQVELRDKVNAIGTLDRERVIQEFAKAVDTLYVRKPMKDFEYLSAQVKPTFGQWLFAMGFGLVLSIGLGIFFLKNDMFDEGDRYGYRY
jgi:hypothetical protein